jgi:hypothetical protein
MSADYEVQALGSTGPEMPPDEPLIECFRELAQDRIRTAGELLLVSASKCLQACGGGTFVRPLEGGDRCLRPADLEQALAPLMEQHGWRGPVRRWLHSLLGIEKVAASDGLQAPFHELVAEECGLWIEPNDEDAARAWGGRPLGRGVRLVNRDAPLPALQEGLDSEGVVLVAAPSEHVGACLARHAAGCHVILSDGGATLAGRLLARQLAQAGCEVRFVYDSALPGLVHEADMVWIGTEAIGAEGFVAPVGTRMVLAEAVRQEVPLRLLATSDLVLPGADLELPRWGDEETWRLWEDPVNRALLESQPFERVPFPQQLMVACEQGLLRPSDYALAVLDTETPRRFSTSG